MTETPESTIVREIIAEFAAFKEHYDQYRWRVDDLHAELERGSKFYEETKFLLYGTDSVSSFTRHAGRVVNRLENLLMIEGT